MKRARCRQGLPRAWLFTDERLGGADRADPLWAAISRLPRGGGIVVRHYSLPDGERRLLLAQVRRVARPRGLTVVASGIAGAADGVHRPARAVGRSKRLTAGVGGGGGGPGIVTAAAHGRREVVQAFAAGAALVFLSPVFPTASHPGGRILGPVRFGLAVRAVSGPVLALGGMTAARERRMRALGAAGYGAIDAWVEGVEGLGGRFRR